MHAVFPTLPSERVWLWRMLAAILIVGAAVLRILYLLYWCPLDLATDEAHYWDWSRRLDWSYYSKGPLVAYLIRLSCWCLGTDGADDPMVAVRLPAVLCGSLLLVSLYVLVQQVMRSERWAVLVVAGALTLPLLAAGSLLMTIDAPFCCCWCWAVLLGYLAVLRGVRWAWPLLGMVLALGMLAKYTMVLWLPCLAGFLLVTPGYRAQLWQPGFWLAVGLAGLGCLPIAVWNFQHDWVTFKHMNSHVGLDVDTWRWRWLGPLHYIGAQCAVWLVFWFLLWAVAMWRQRPGREVRPERLYLWWLSLPIFLFFLAFSVSNGGGEANWPAPAYLAGMVLTVAWLQEIWPVTGVRWRRTLRWGITATCLAGVLGTTMLYDSKPFRPFLQVVAGEPSAARPEPLRRVDLSCRLRGWHHLGAAVDQVRGRLAREEGIEPILATDSWSSTGETAFYCRGQPTVYSLGAALGCRHSQYDLWRPNPLLDPQAFAGRTFLMIGWNHEKLAAAFATVTQAKYVIYLEDGQPISRRWIFICKGFRGFPTNDPGKRF